MSLTSLEKSLEVTLNKLALGFISSYENSKSGLKYKNDREFLELMQSFQKIDPHFNEYLKEHKPYKWQLMFRPKIKETGSDDLKKLVQQLQTLQKNDPEKFVGLNPEYFVKDWDLEIFNIIENLEKVGSNDILDLKKVQELQAKIKNLELIKPNLNLTQTMQEIDGANKKLSEELNQNLQEIFSKNQNELNRLCPQDEFENFLLSSGNSCPLPEQRDLSSIEHNLSNLSTVLNSNWANMPRPENPPPPPPPEPEFKTIDLEIKKTDLETNDGVVKTAVCKRDPAMADTIVIHHTAGNPERETIDTINEMHLNNQDNDGSYWYMIAYHYAVTGGYADDGISEVYQARPLEYAGAHAGGQTKGIDPEIKKIVEESTFECGSEKYGFSKTNGKRLIDSNGETNANYTSIGIVVIGNYAPQKGRYIKVKGNPDKVFRITGNEAGYPPDQPRYPNENILTNTAQLVCKLQKEYPRLKYIKPHLFINSATECPGLVKERLGHIIEKAKEYGCDFQL